MAPSWKMQIFPLYSRGHKCLGLGLMLGLELVLGLK